MTDLNRLLENNRTWSAEVRVRGPGFFAELAREQGPQYLWIGCSDSRVPANQIVGLLPGEMFVHRNVANVVVHADLNCLSVMQYAVDVLRVRHVIVCGHYGCGGVLAALAQRSPGADRQLAASRPGRAGQHQVRLDALPTEARRHERLCELNVIEQAVNVCQTTVVREAWGRRPAADGAWVGLRAVRRAVAGTRHEGGRQGEPQGVL